MKRLLTSDKLSRCARGITAVLLALAVVLTAFDAEAARRKRRKRVRKKPKVTKVVWVTPTASGPLAETDRFVTFTDRDPVPRGLDNRVIALWQSHGKYYDQDGQRWRWQRPRLFGTVEDLLAQGFVMPYLMPMLENAGAYVMSPRERDTNLHEIIIDTDGWERGDFYLKNGARHWKESAHGQGFANKGGTLGDGENPFTAGTSECVETVGPDDKASTANWTADIPARGRYAVYVSYRSYPNSASDAHYTIHHLGGATHVTVNQQMAGGTWLYLGHYDLAKGKPKHPIVVLDNLSEEEGTVVSADAVKIGGGMGNVARKPCAGKGNHDLEAVTSGSPRFTEGARYWLQWAGMPQSVYTESAGTNDYTDDYKCRALWVNYLAGGSPMLPDSVGLNVPIDLALAFHTDAGKTDDGSVVGTLGIYSTDDGKLLGDGRSRLDARDLTETVIGQVVNDMRALHDSVWTNRGVRDRKYYEIRETKVPAMIIELLSHQNFTDMTFALDPKFRFDVARAVYKGLLRFLSKRYNQQYQVQPLPVRGFSIIGLGHSRYRLTWRPTVDPLEPSAFSKQYVVEERVESGAFRRIAVVSDPMYEVTTSDNHIHSYRIVAVNDGGCSFPSEVLALRDNGKGAPQVNVVNGFTRISAPDTFCEGDYRGFDYHGDAGVADVEDIITTGVQYNYKALSEYVDNDSPGHGASRGNLEKVVTGGNTHDFVYVHGRAVAAAGYGFVSASVEAFANDVSLKTLGTPANPPVVDLILGKQKEILPGKGEKGTGFKAFPMALQTRLESHLNQGGSLLVSGAFIGTDLLDNRHSDEATREVDRRFATDVLGIDWQLGRTPMDGKVSMVPSHFKPFGWNDRFTYPVAPAPGCYAVETPDAIRPYAPGAATIMRYDETGLSAAVAYERPYTMANGKFGSGRVVSMGFPFEAVRTEKSRALLMRDILKFLVASY